MLISSASIAAAAAINIQNAGIAIAVNPKVIQNVLHITQFIGFVSNKSASNTLWYIGALWMRFMTHAMPTIVSSVSKIIFYSLYF